MGRERQSTGSIPAKLTNKVKRINRVNRGNRINRVNKTNKKSWLAAAALTVLEIEYLGAAPGEGMLPPAAALAFGESVSRMKLRPDVVVQL
jgi:hypothetical protein